MSYTESNKAFIVTLISEKRQLKDFPERISSNFVNYQPASLPFGGVYKGLDEYEKFISLAIKFYDFKRFHLINVYADGDAVFAIIEVGIANSDSTIMLCEHFTFKEETLQNIRVFVFDKGGIPQP